MSDIATLGVAIDTSAAKDASSVLDAFTAQAALSETQISALEASAKRANVTFEEMRKRFENSTQGIEGIRQKTQAMSGELGKSESASKNASSATDKLRKSNEDAEKATKSHSQELGRFSSAFRVVTDEISSNVSRAQGASGLLGEVVSKLGPAGVAAAVGLGAFKLIMAGLVEPANALAEKAKSIRELMEATGLASDELRAISKEASKFGADTEDTQRALTRFTIAIDQVRQGSGELFTQMNRVDTRLTEQLAGARTTAQAWDIFGQAIKRVTDEQQRNALIRSALGGRGGSTIPVGLAAGAISDAGGVSNVADSLDKSIALTKEQIETFSKLRLEILKTQSQTKDIFALMFTEEVLRIQLQFSKNMNELARIISSFTMSEDFKAFRDWFNSAAKYLNLTNPMNLILPDLKGAGDALKQMKEWATGYNAALMDPAGVETVKKVTTALEDQKGVSSDLEKLWIQREDAINHVISKQKMVSEGPDNNLMFSEDSAKLKEWEDHLDKINARIAEMGDSAKSGPLKLGTVYRSLDNEIVSLIDENLKLAKGVDSTSTTFKFQSTVAGAQVESLGNAATASEKYEVAVLKLKAAHEEGQITSSTMQRALAELGLQYSLVAANAKIALGIATQEEIERSRATATLHALNIAGISDEKERASALELSRRASVDAYNQEQIRAAGLSQLKRLELDSGNLKLQVDTTAVSSLNAFTSGLSDIVTGAKTAKDAMLDFGKSVAKAFADAAIKQFITAPLAAQLQGAFGGLTGVKDVSSTITGTNNSSNTAATAAQQTAGLEKAISSGTASGLGDFFSSMTKPGSGFGGGAGGSAVGQGATALAGAAAAYSVGYSSGNATTGALGGGLMGAVAGFSVAGPVGAAVGGVIGALTGLFGASQKAADELKAAKDEWNKQAVAVHAFNETLAGNTPGSLTSALTQAENQVKQYTDAAQKAKDFSAVNELNDNFAKFKTRLTSEFRDLFDEMNNAFESGMGSNSPLVQAAKNVTDLTESLRAFITDTTTAFGGVDAGAASQTPSSGGRVVAELGSKAATAGSATAASNIQGPEIDRARQSAQAYLLTLLDGTKQLSETQTSIMQLRGTAIALQTSLVELGMSSDDAARAISDRLGAAMDKLRDKFDNDITRRINDASNKGYLNDISDLLKEMRGLAEDATSLGEDPSRVGELLKLSAQKIVDSENLTGSAFDDLVKLFPQLSGVVHASVGQIADDTERLAQAQARSLGYQNREFAATNNSSTLEGSLAAFDRSASQQRAEEIKAGGDAINDLERALSAERLGIIRDFSTRAEQAAADEAAKAAQAAADAAAKAVDEQLQAQKQGLDRSLSYWDRAYAALGSETGSLEAELSGLERKAGLERASEVEAGGQAMEALEQAIAAERIQIIKKYADDAAAVEESATQRRLGYWRRAYAAMDESSTLQGALAGFDREAALQRIDEQKSGGQAMEALEQALSAERLQIIKKFSDDAAAVEEAASQRRLGYWQRVYAAMDESSTLQGALAGFDREAALQRINEQKAGGQAMDVLEQALSAERLGIIKKFADEAAATEEAATQRRLGFWRRAYAAMDESSTLAGALAGFDREAALQRIDEQKAGGQAMDALEQALSAERLQIIKKFADEAAAVEKASADRRLSFQDRLFAATNDNSTLEGQLAAFDRDAQKQRLAEMAAGGQAINDLEAALAAERLGIIKKANDAVLESQRQSFENIQKFIDQQLSGSSSPLSPQDRLNAARSQFESQYSLAQGGDTGALGNITSAAQNLIDAARTAFASTEEFQSTFQSTLDRLASLSGYNSTGTGGVNVGVSASGSGPASSVIDQQSFASMAANDNSRIVGMLTTIADHLDQLRTEHSDLLNLLISVVRDGDENVREAVVSSIDRLNSTTRRERNRPRAVGE